MCVLGYGTMNKSSRIAADTIDECANYLTTPASDPIFYNSKEQLQDYQHQQCCRSPWRCVSSQHFTNVTTAACQRQNECHWSLGHNHLNLDTSQRRAGKENSSPCNRHHQQILKLNCIPTPLSQNQIEVSNAFNEDQYLPQMLWKTCPTGSGYRTPTYWASCQDSAKDSSVNQTEETFSSWDLFSSRPSILCNLPPTPVDTEKATEVWPTSLPRSSPSSSPLLASPVAKTQDLERQATATNINVTTNLLRDNIPQHMQNNVEVAPDLQEVAGLRDPLEGTRVPQDSDSTRNDLNAYNSPLGLDVTCGPQVTSDSVAGNSLVVEFPSPDWDVSTFDFLNDANEYSFGSTSRGHETWNGTEDLAVSDYPALSVGSELHRMSDKHLLNHPEALGFPSDNFFGHQIALSRNYGQAETHLCFPNVLQSGSSPFETQAIHSLPSSASPSNNKTTVRSKSKDKMLVELKGKGYSYKDIKVMGQFEEAESTLRGRYRTLTKPKEARVRKPEWGDRDIALLLEGVAAHTNCAHDHIQLRNRSISTMGRRADKIPWKQVAEYMALRGCYKYGNATVKKKWTEIMESRLDNEYG